jgi:surfeit locus 1 family protein
VNGRPGNQVTAPQAATRLVRRWGFFGLALLVGLICIRLGLWQLDRLADRRSANSAIRARLELPELSLPDDLAEGADLAYRTAVARGEFDPRHEMYLTSRARDGIAGLQVVTPLLLMEGGPAVLVNRGWISDADYRRLPPDHWTERGQIEVRGVLLPSQPEPAMAFLADRVPAGGEPPRVEWRALSIEGMRRQIPYPILDVYLAQQSPSASPNAPRPSTEVDLSEGPHLGYAIQWFAFAAIALIGAGLWLRRGQRYPGLSS